MTQVLERPADAQQHGRMILIFGTRASESLMVIVTFVCNYCRQEVPQEVYKRVNRFALFFIPLFPVSTRYYVRCSNCGGTTALTREQAHHSLDWAERSRVQG